MVLAYLPAFGSGLGHVSRLSIIARELQSNGFDVRFSSFGEGAKYLKEHGFQCDICPEIDVGWADGKVSAKKTLLGLPNMMISFAKQIRFEAKNIKALKPKVVFADSRLSSVIAASREHIPCITMLNQVRIKMPENGWSRVSSICEETMAELLGRMWALSKKILVPDLPPPYAICENNISNISSISKKTTYIGFLVKKKEFKKTELAKLKTSFGINGSKLFFAQISGPAGTREGAIRKIIEASKKANGGFSLIISGGVVGGETKPLKIGNSWYFEWCPIRDELFTLADFSIIRGGHSTIAQSLSHGKPMIILPIEKHSEQIGNGNKVSALGAGICIKAEDLKIETLLESAEQISSDDRYTRNAQEIAYIAEDYDGPVNAVQAVLSACN
jgi:UDP:flavonoid glycosyltransferase YjiC (YdhE family)